MDFNQEYKAFEREHMLNSDLKINQNEDIAEADPDFS